MNDRYLFKAKSVDNKEWVQGYFMKRHGIPYIFETRECPQSNYEVDETTICQCTGLKDKNGKLIWENDVVNCIEAECCGRIVLNESEAGFYFDVLLEDGTYKEEHIYDYVDCMDVIGNVFDNPKLLEECDTIDKRRNS